MFVCFNLDTFRFAKVECSIILIIIVAKNVLLNNCFSMKFIKIFFCNQHFIIDKTAGTIANHSYWD